MTGIRRMLCAVEFAPPPRHALDHASGMGAGAQRRRHDGVFGSTTQHVVHKAASPVLTERPATVKLSPEEQR